MRRAVPADRQKPAVTLSAGLAGKLNRMARPARGDHIDLESALSQTGKRRPGERHGTAATRGGIHDGEKALHHAKIILSCRHPPRRAANSTTLERQNRCLAFAARKPLRQRVALDLERRRSRKVLFSQHDSVNALIV